MKWSVPALYRRATLIYLATIVVPVVAFLWLGVQAYRTQSGALAVRTAQQVATELEHQTRAAAERALFEEPHHPIVRFTFALHDGQISRPRLHDALSEVPPPEFRDALREEMAGHLPAALDLYQQQLKAGRHPALALEGKARCLDLLGRPDDARETWRRLAKDFPDEESLLHRPYGIVAAIHAQETSGLVQQIESGRWQLAGDYARHVLEQLAPSRTSRFLQQFEFAEALNDRFHPSGTLGDREVRSDAVDSYRVFYRGDGPDRIVGIAIDETWVNSQLRPPIERTLGVGNSNRRDRAVYLGSVILVLGLLSAGVLLMLRDVSREARTNQARAELVSSVSHELKTPITLVRLYSETLLRHRDFPEEDRVGFYRIIARESTRLGRLVDQVLTFSRVDRGAQVYHFEEGDLATVVCGVVEDYREYLEHAGFTLHQSLAEPVPAARFDGAAISQALVNLLDNAVKYSGDSRDIKVRLTPGDGQVTIEVEDRGIGIDPAEHERIFGRFYRIANSNGKGGYGLGLFLVRHIMEAHGGRTEVDSTPGRGSRFRLILPTTSPWPASAS
jgi:signal transduction histidine kinase